MIDPVCIHPDNKPGKILSPRDSAAFIMTKAKDVSVDLDSVESLARHVSSSHSRWAILFLWIEDETDVKFDSHPSNSDTSTGEPVPFEISSASVGGHAITHCLLVSQIHEATTHTPYDLKSWKRHALHPKEMNEATVEWIFVADLLNFSFWASSYQVEQKASLAHETLHCLHSSSIFRDKCFFRRWNTMVSCTKATGHSVRA